MSTNNIHPAQYSKELISPLVDLLVQYAGSGYLLDPFGGLGWKLAEIANLANMYPIGIEIESAYLPYAHPCIELGDSTHLPYRDECFDAAVTSPVYPNGCADYFNAKDDSKRNTYIHRIREKIPSYKLHRHNPASYSPRGSEKRYSKFMMLNHQVYKQVFRVLNSGAPFLVNTKDTKKYDFTKDNNSSLEVAGFEIINIIKVNCPGLNHGRNQENKLDYENITVCRRP